MRKAKDKREEKIKRAFLDLVEEKGFNKVSVKDIAEKSGITRGTFYLYFEDKYDLLHCVEDELIKGMAKTTNEVPYKEVAYFGYTDEYIEKIVNYFYINGKEYVLLMGRKGDPEFTERVREAFFEYWKDQGVLNNLIIPKNYAASALDGLLSNILVEWVKNGFKESEKEVTKIIKKLVGNFLPNMFEK